MHDASVRVPTVLRVLEAAGVPVPPEMQGRPLLLLLSGRNTDWPREILIQVSESEASRALRTQRCKYAATAPDADAWGDMRATHYQDACLYDLDSDPDELTNLVDDPGHDLILAQLRERLPQHIVDSGEPRPHIAARQRDVGN